MTDQLPLSRGARDRDGSGRSHNTLLGPRYAAALVHMPAEHLNGRLLGHAIICANEAACYCSNIHVGLSQHNRRMPCRTLTEHLCSQTTW